MLQASTQNNVKSQLGMVLAISQSDLLFLSTTSLCWGDLEAENSSYTMCVTRIFRLLFFKFSFMASSFGEHKVYFIWDFLQSFENIFNVSSLVEKKDRQVNLEISSPTRRAYLLPPRLRDLVGLKRSIYNSSKGLEDEMWFLGWNKLFVAYPFIRVTNFVFFKSLGR